MPNPVYGCLLASWSAGLFVHPDIVLEGNNASTYEVIPADEYEVHSETGYVVRRPYDGDVSPNAVDWTTYSAFRASYYLYNPSTNSATAHPTNEAQTVTELDLGIMPFDPVTRRLNESTAPMHKFLVGDYLSLGTVGSRPVDSNTGTGIWGDKTGLYGLNAGTRNFYLLAADGKAYAGAGNVVLDTTGIMVYSSAVLQAQLDSTGLALLDDAKLGINVAIASMEANTRVQIYETGDSNDAAILILDVSDTQHGGLKLQRARASLAATQAGDDFGSIVGKGHTGSAYVSAPQTWVRFRAAENTSGTNQGSYISFETTPNASTAAAGRREVFRIGQDGSVFIGDTSNANQTVGVTINQGANDNAILSLKSSDVGHGVTDIAETDTYAYGVKQHATAGGLNFVGLSEDVIGFQLAGVATNDNTTKSTAGTAPIVLNGFKKSGTGVGAVGADGNIVAFRNSGTTRFLLDAEGDSHQDVGTAWTNFDEHDDLALLNLVSAHVTRQDDPLRKNFGAWLEQSRDDLERLDLVTFNADGHHFVNWSRMHMLEVGALRQIGERLEHLEQIITNHR